MEALRILWENGASRPAEIQARFQWEIDNGTLHSTLVNLVHKKHAMRELCKCPEKHDFAPENRRWNPELNIRQMRFKPRKTKSAWRVLYGLDETSGIITVLQVRHEHRRLLF
jgi:hypothetical protein